MANDQLTITEPKGFQPASETVTQRLEREGFVFNHELFYRRLKEIKDLVLADGEIVFIPLVWGQPLTETVGFTKDNRLTISYQVSELIAYPYIPLRDAPMGIRPTPGEVEERMRMVQNFELLRFPHLPNGFNCHNYVTSITDEDGLCRISLNCPYGLIPSEEAPVRINSRLSAHYENTLATRLLFAAILKEMGYDEEFIFKAVAYQSGRIDRADKKIEFVTDKTRALTSLYLIPSLRRNFLTDDKTLEIKGWKKTENLPYDIETVYKTVITSAHFAEDHNVYFKITPEEILPKTLNP